MLKALFSSFGLVVFLCILLFSRCANRMAPGGGPEDKTPPAILTTEPSPDTLRVSRDARINITFSEWIRSDDIEKSVFVSPTRPKVKIKASGRHLSIIPQSPLMDSTTYVVVLGTEMQDLYGNKLASAYTLSFSTGSFLDSGQIRGLVLDEQGRPFAVNASVFAYLKNDTVQINPAKDLPDYITQSGSDGAFVFKNLRFGTYRLFAVVDYNRNRRFNTDRELIGIPPFDALISPTKPRCGGFVFIPQKQDTLPLFLNKAVLKAGGQLFLTWNKSVADSVRLNPACFTIIRTDSLQSVPETLRITALYPAPDDSLSQLLLVGPTPAHSKYRCTVKGVFAQDGARLDSLKSSVDFAGNPASDSVAPQLIRFYPTRYATGVAEQDSLLLFFSEPVRTQPLLEGVSLEKLVITREKKDSLFRYDTLVTGVSGKGYFRTPMEFVFKTDSSLVFGGVYRWRLLPAKLIDAAGNFSSDTLMKGSFTVIAEGEYGTLSGKAVTADPGRVRITLLAKTGKKMVETSPDNNGYYRLDGIPEGDYRILGYVDKDGNRVRDPGRLKPFSFSEAVLAPTDSVHVRKRWDVEKLDLRMPE